MKKTTNLKIDLYFIDDNNITNVKEKIFIFRSFKTIIYLGNWYG
jgi:hypothetical protein